MWRKIRGDVKEGVGRVGKCEGGLGKCVER